MSILECDVDKVMDYLKQEAKEDGHAEGLAEGRMEMQLSSVRAIMKNLNMTPTQAMDCTIVFINNAMYVDSM